MSGPSDGEPRDASGDGAGPRGAAGPSPDAPAPDGGPIDGTDGTGAVERAAGSADQTVPRSTGPAAWTAVEERVRLSEQPWWEADGAPPPHPDARPWHARSDEASSGTDVGPRSSSSGFGRWFGTETRRREILVAIAGVLAFLVVVLTAYAWLATAVGGP